MKSTRQRILQTIYIVSVLITVIIGVKYFIYPQSLSELLWFAATSIFTIAIALFFFTGK